MASNSSRQRPRFTRSSATVLSVVSLAIFSILRNFHLLSDVGYRELDHEHFVHGLPLLVQSSSSSSPKNTFSACLLTMDDNHLLVEWLAYHYHTLPLRRLIVAVDPNSVTSPSEILERWRSQGMSISEWTDSDYMRPLAPKDLKFILKKSNISNATRIHHFRQRSFFRKCMQTLQNENRTWTMFLDSDEYLFLNRRFNDEEAVLPSLRKPGSILSFLDKQQYSFRKSPCIMIPRLLFGAIEKSTPPTIESPLFNTLNASSFTTLRFTHHAPLNDFQVNKIGKGILNLSLIKGKNATIRDPHRLVWEYCPEEGLRQGNEDSGLVIHHYLGSFEQFNARNDVRKGDTDDERIQVFRQFEKVDAGSDNSIQPWINGFVEDKGVDTAASLLEGIGDVSRWATSATKKSASTNDAAFASKLGLALQQSLLDLNRRDTEVPKENAFSACLIVMDDNFVLVEWLAYHYHALPLRRLIVAVDPRSKTSPSGILGRWRDHGLAIDEWSDKDFMTEKLFAIAQNVSSLNKTAVVDLHLERQNQFYQKCMESLQKENRTWTMLIDTDEFLMINKRATDRFNVTDVPPMEQPGSIMTFLKQELAKNETEMPQDSPCIMIPRLRFGSKESNMEKVNRDVPSGWNGTAFTTLRYRKHGEPRLSKFNKGGKVIIDVSRVHPANMHVNNPHRPLTVYCPKEHLHTQIKDNLFVVHHYTGSLEQFTFRDDYRDTKKKKAFDQMKFLNEDDDNIRPWLGGFVEDKGKDAASELLRGAGEIRWIGEIESPKEKGPVDRNNFAACLLVMDDNHVLIEWLAYHYHALPLRYLIVTSDPRSITSPSEILARWRNHGMTIEEWSDKDFMPPKLLQVAQNMHLLNKTQIIELHRARQRVFYEQCMKRHKSKRRSWTMLTDTDEFLLINNRTTTRFNVTDAPPIEEPGSIIKFIKQERAKNVTEMPRHTACIMIPRLRFGSKESTHEEINIRVPAGFNASAFTTLRHRKHAEPKLSVINKTGKTIVDVSRIHPKRMKVKNPHRPLWAYCPKDHLFTLLSENLLVVHHYAGTWEQYTFRDDFRAMKTKQEFKKYNNRNEDDDAIRPWLDGFVQDKGHEAASLLLKDVGDVPPRNVSAPT